MGDVGDDFRALREHRKEQRRKHGVDCPQCCANFPNRNPSILMPGQRCRWCGYVDQRPKGEQ